MDNANEEESCGVFKVFGPESVIKLPQKLLIRGDDIVIDIHEGLAMAGKHEVISSTYDLEEHIHHCHERIMEFDHQLKQRESVVYLLVESLGAVLRTLEGVQLHGGSANENVAVLMSQVQHASKLLQQIGLEDGAVYNTSTQEQGQSVANEIESSAVIEALQQNNSNHDPRPNKIVREECETHCLHSEEISQITEKVYMGLDKLHISSDISQQSDNITGKIECLTMHAMRYKHEAEEAELLKKENESIQSLLLAKEAEVMNTNAKLEELQLELNEYRNELNTSDNPEEKKNGNLKTSIYEKEMADSSAIMNHDKCLQSMIDMKIMDALLERLPHKSSQLLDDTLTDKLLELKLAKSDHFRTCINHEIIENDVCPNANRAEEEVYQIGIKQAVSDLHENCKSNVFIHGCSHGLETVEKSVIMDVTGESDNKTNANEMESETSESFSVRFEILENLEKHAKEELIKSLGDCENMEELILNLGSKARELLLVKEQLKIMKEKECKLQSQLDSAIDSCKKAEKQYRYAENVAMNLQNNLESMHCNCRASEMNKTNFDAENLGKVISISKASPSPQVSVENCSSSLDLVEAFTEIGEEYLSSFLVNFWKKIGLIVNILNIPEEKPENFLSKKMASLKASLESDMNELSVYLKRKFDKLKQMKLSLDAESQFHDLQVEFEKKLMSQGDFKSVFPEEMKQNERSMNSLTNNMPRDDECPLSDLLGILYSLHKEMDFINSKVMKCLKYSMEQDFEKQSIELSMNYANEIASMKELHATQIKKLKEEIVENLSKFQAKMEEAMANLGICTKVDYSEMFNLQESHNRELKGVWNKLDVKQKEVYDCLKERYERIATEQISLATRIYKENYDFKTKQEISFLKSIHEQEMEVMKSTLEHQKLKELFSVRQEISKSYKENINEMIQAVEADMKELRCRCQGLALKTSLANTVAMDQLRKSLISECQLAIKELRGMCFKKFENEVKALEMALCEKNKEKEHLMSILPDDIPQPQMPQLWELLLSKSEVYFREVTQCQLLGMQELMEKLQVEHNQLKDKLSRIQSNGNLDASAMEEEGELLERKSTCSTNLNLSSVMDAIEEPWIDKMQNLRIDLEVKHAKEMESLRLYFEKKYAEVEKRYSEEVLAQRSKKYSHSCSSDSSDTNLSGFDGGLEHEQFFLTNEEMATPRGSEAYEQVSLDMQLIGQDKSSLDKECTQHNGLQISSLERIPEELRFQFEKELQRRLADIIKQLEAKHEEDLKIQIAAEAEAYSKHIEEVTNAIKKCSEEEQEKFVKSHREMVDDFLRQHKENLKFLKELHDSDINSLRNSNEAVQLEELRTEIDKMKSRRNQDLVIAKLSGIDEASQKLIQEHANENRVLMQRLKSDHNEELNKLKEGVKQKNAYCEELKCLAEAELETMRGNFEVKLQEGIEQAKRSITKSLAEQIQALLSGNRAGVIKESSSDQCKSELANLKEQLGLIIGRLSIRKKCHAKEIECMNEDQKMELNKLVSDSSEWSYSLEQSKNAHISKFGESDVELEDATSVTILCTDLDKLCKNSDKWRKISWTLKRIIMDLLEYTHNCEEEINGTIVQSILRLSGVNEKCILSKDDVVGEPRPRRVHFAPDVLTNILPQSELEVGEEENVISKLEESSEEMRVELKMCLERLRAEANALLALSDSLKLPEEDLAFNGNLVHSQQELMNKISLLENHLKVETMEKDRLKVELHTTKGLCEGHASTEATLLARATQAEAQLAALLMKKDATHGGVETITEGFGEGSGPSNFDKLLHKLAQLREKARWVLKQHHDQEENNSGRDNSQTGSSSPLIVHLIEELCSEVDRLSEEARKDREDLQLQVEAADKQLRSTRAFLEEQAIEREQEREEFQKELNRLHEALGGRERDKEERERMVREVDVLEHQCKELTQMLKDTTNKKEELEAELKAAIDKVWDLREIIRELESQVEGSFLLERDLRSQNEKLTTEMALQSKKLNDLIEELESLQSSLGYSMPGEMENENHTVLLEEALRNHCLQVEQAKALGSSLKDLKKQLLEMGASIDMKTKELEALQVMPVTSANCNSPSEDVSVREQLEQATWRSESPMEDEVANRDLTDGNGIIESEGKGITALELPRVPLAELCHLQEKLIRHSQAQEPFLKRIHDLEMQIQSLKHNEEELMTEREVLQSQVEEQLLQASELQARLDEVRRRGGHHIHCVTVTPLPSSPLSRSPIGSPSTKSDHPSFCCAGLADARHEIENLTECLEKKELEVTQLRRSLEDSKKVVILQEKELTNKIREEAEMLKMLKKFEILDSEKNILQMKLSQKNKNDGEVPFSLLLDNLLAEKNEEIEFLGLQIANLQDQLSKALSNEENKSLPQKLKHVTEFNQLVEVKQVAENSEKNNSGSQEDVEVLRDCAVSFPSLDKGNVVHQEESEGYHKLWFHSTKIEAQNLSTSSPGLAVSPLTPYGKLPVCIKEPVLEEESLEKTPLCTLSDLSCSCKEEVEANVKCCDSVDDREIHSNVQKDVEIQTEEQNIMENLNLTIQTKEDEIKALKNKVDVLLGEKDNLSQLMAELREKIEWHSRHLEKYEEESMGRDALINEVQAEKKELKASLQKSEQEVSTWKNSHTRLQDRIEVQEEQIKTLNGKVNRYSKVNMDQHLLLKAAQQERKYIISILSSLGFTSPENSTSDGKDDGSKLSGQTSPNTSLRELAVKLVDQVHALRVELNSIVGERNQLKQDLEKAVVLQAIASDKGSSTVDIAGESERQKTEDVNPNNEKLEPISIQGDRGPSPSLVSLEQMMQKVQQEGIEVLSLSELAVGKRSIPCDTPLISSPFGSPKSACGTNKITSKGNSSFGSFKIKSDICADDDRVQLLMRVQALENELSSKEREEVRKRDWLEFHEKEGLAGWTGVVEAVGQKQRHELNILERLGEQRNARAKLEAAVDQLRQQLSQAEAEIRKVTYRLGMERSHVIRLESALQQEKSNFSQLQLSLDSERRRTNMMKELNLKVNKALQSELIQHQAKVSYLQKSLKEEHGLRMEVEAQMKQMQKEQGYVAEASVNQKLRLDAIANEECRQLRKIEEDCERKALEQELENEKQKRVQSQREILQLRSLLESRPNNEPHEPVESIRWSNAAFPSTPCGSDSSFNAEDMLQNLKGINQVLGWHIRQREDYQNPILASAEIEKHYLEAKCYHLQQKLETIQNVVDQERALWANEKSLLMKDQQYLLETNSGVSHYNVPEELQKFQELVKQLYSLYWRSERNRKALAWQKQYFLSVLVDLRNLKGGTITDFSKVAHQEKVAVDKITELERIPCYKQFLHQKPKSQKSFRVLVWTVIAILKMKVLVLRSMTGIQVGCQSLLENVLQPTCSYTKVQHSPYNHQHFPHAGGSCEMSFPCGVPNLSSSNNSRKSNSVGSIIYQRFP